MADAPLRYQPEQQGEGGRMSAAQIAQQEVADEPFYVK